MDKPQVQMFTDGACKGNPGIGGWGVLLRFGVHEKTFCGGEANTTNNRMELMAVINGLSALNKPCEVHLYTDSKYVMQGITKWIHNWKKQQWKTANKKPVKNQELWQLLDAATQQHHIHWHWVKGHAGHDGNERADELANQGVQSVLKIN